MILFNCSLTDVESYYRQGRVSREEVVKYIRKWNSAPRFTQAVLIDSRIVNFDPEEQGWKYKHLAEEFGVCL